MNERTELPPDQARLQLMAYSLHCSHWNYWLGKYRIHWIPLWVVAGFSHYSIIQASFTAKRPQSLTLTTVGSCLLGSEGAQMDNQMQGCWFGTVAPQLVPEQLTVASNTKFLVPELGSWCMIHVTAPLAVASSAVPVTFIPNEVVCVHGRTSMLVWLLPWQNTQSILLHSLNYRH